MKNQTPNKMNNLLQKLETYKSQNNPKRFSVEKTPRKSSLNFYLQQEDFIRRNSFQNVNIDVNTRALETLTDAALKVKNLLSDFLVNADPDDKQKYNIEDELKEIKKNKNNENLNIYTLIGDNSGKSSEENEENNINYNKKNEFKRKSDLTKRNSILLSMNQDDFNDKGKESKRFKKNKILTMGDANEDTLNAINKIQALKMSIKRNSKMTNYKRINSINYLNNNLFNFKKRISSEKNLIDFNNRKLSSDYLINKSKRNSNENFLNLIKRKSSGDYSMFIKKRKTSSDYSQKKRKSSSDFTLNRRKSTLDNLLKPKKRISSEKNTTNNENIKNNNIELKSSFLGKKKINKAKVHFSNKDTNFAKGNFKIKRRKKRLDTYQAPSPTNISSNNNNINFTNYQNSLKSQRSVKSHRSFKKSKTLKFKETTLIGNLSPSSDDSLNLSKTSIYSKKDNNDIRNYISFTKKGFREFNDICKNLRKSIVFNEQDKKNLLSKFGIEETNISNKTSIHKMRTLIEDRKYKNEDEEDKKSFKESDIDEEKSQDIKIIEFQYRRLIRQNKYVYDSLSDEESLDDEDGKIFIDPLNQIKLIFDFLIFSLSCFSITYPIYAFGFKLSPKYVNSNCLISFHITFDIFCFIDFIIGFFTAYYNFEEQLITKNELIFIHYIKGWFIIDFLSAIPFNTINIYFPFKNIKKDKLRFIKDNSLLELLILLRLLKLFKVFMNNAFINKINKLIEGFDALVKWSRVYISLFIGIASIHVLSCIFIFLGTLQFPNWIYENGYELTSEQRDIYITAFYYICATVFTIGYGDICSISQYERFFNLILLVVGIMIYSYAVSALSNYVQSVDSKTLDYQNKLSILETIRVSHEKMPQSLYDKISKFLLYRLHNETRDKNEIIDNLPIALRNKLIIEMYRDVIKNFVFFKKFDNTDFIIQVILAMKPIQASHNERLVNEGEYIEEIYFVKRGILSLEIPLPVIIKEETIQKMETIKLARAQRRFGIKNATLNFLRQSSVNNGTSNRPSEIDIPSDDDLKNSKNQIQRPTQTYIKIIEIRRNEHFGDILMFLNKRSPLSVKVKSKVCELFLLKKTDAVEISMNFPKIWRKIIKKSLFNMEQIERLINKTLRFFFVHNEGHKLRRDSVMKENYYRIDPTKQNKLLNSNNLYQNLDTYELKSIPSEGEDEESSDDTITEEDENEIEEEKSDSDFNSEASSHFETNRKINFSDDINSKVPKNEKENESNKNNSIISEEKIDKSIIEKNDKNLKIIINGYDDFNGSDLETLRENENSFNEKGKSNRSDDSITSRMSEKTVKTVIKNSFGDYKSVYNEKDIFNVINNGTLISSNNITLPYSLDEINNENLPFEESISIPNEDIPMNLLPYDIINNINMKNNIHNNSLNNENNLRNFNNIDCSDNNNFNNANTIVNNNNINTIINNINEKELKTFKNLSWHRIINFTIFGISKKKKIYKTTINTFRSNKTSKTNKINKKFESCKVINHNKSFQAMKMNNNNNINSPSSPDLNQKELKNSKSSPRIKKINLEEPKNQNLNNKISLMKSKSLIGGNGDKRLSKLIFSTSIPKFENENNIDKEKEKIKNKMKQTSKIRVSRTLNAEYINLFDNNNNQENNHKTTSKKKKNTLHLISQNISQNSINLNDPNKFYSNYFSSIIEKTDKKTNENGVPQRLNKLKAFIQSHSNTANLNNNNGEPPN